MSVRKIRKFSSWSLLILVVISIIVVGMFFLGGSVDSAAARPEPVYTEALLYWTYAVIGISILALVFFGLMSFVSTLKTNPKKALGSLLMVVALAAVLFISYAIGSTEPLPLGADFVQYNVPGYLKSADMWLYTIYTVLALCFVAMGWGAIRTALRRK